jgi:hypothetical protein
MHMLKSRVPALLLALAVIVTAMPATAGEEIIDGVKHVRNGATPAKGNRVVKLQEAWRVGGDDGEDFFGMISQVRIGEDGRIYLLDTRLSEVPVYSREGDRVATLSREGDGPGEIRIPSNMLFMPDGSLGLVQVFPGKIIKVNLDGSPAGVFQPGGGDPTQGGFLQMFDCSANGQDLVVTAESISQAGPTSQSRSNYVASFDAAGKELVRYFENAFAWDFTNFEFSEDNLGRVDFRRVAVGQDGRLYIATERNAYKIMVYNRDGSVDRVIEREYVHRQRTDEEYNRVKSTVEGQLAQIPNARITVSKTEPDIGGLNFGPDDNLWLSTSRGGVDQPKGVMFTWDVFSPDGKFLETVSAACPGDGENDLIIWTDDGAAVQVTGFTEAARALQSQGGGAASEGDDDGEAAPMEVIYLKVAGA